MKKTIAFLALAFCLGTQVQAQADSTVSKTKTTQGSTKYFYYPEANVYYNETNGNYSYYDPASSTWTTNQQLPANIKIDKNTPRNPINFNGTDVWTDNAAHQKKYGGTGTKTVTPKP